MKTAFKKSHKPATLIGITVIMVMLACNLPDMSPNSSPGAATQTEAAIQWGEAQAEISTPDATAESIQPTESSSSENNNQAACLAGIFPGKTNRTEVITVWGEPAATQQEGSYEVLQYASPLSGQYDTVYLLDQVVASVSSMLAEDNPLAWSAVKAQYGEPAHAAYSDYLEGSRNFAFPEQGLNFIVDPDLDIVFIQECFTPMSLEGYLQAFGNSLPQEDPFTK